MQFVYESYRLYEISFKNLIESHENRKRNKELFNIYDKINMTSSGIEIIPYMENNEIDVIEKLKKYNYSNFIIPKVILEIYPKIKYDDYLKLKEDSIFCSKTTCVCDICYLDITKYCYMGGANMENILRTMKQGKIGLPKLNDNNNLNQINYFNNTILSTKFNDYRKNSSNIKNNNNNSNNKFKNKHSRNNLSQNNFFNSKTQDSNNNKNNNSIFNNNNFNNNTFYNNNFNSNNILNNNNSRNKFRPVSSKMNWKRERNFNNKNNDIYNNENIDKLLDKLLK